MSKIVGLMAMLVMMGTASADGLKVRDLSLDGKIEGENIVFTLNLKAEGLKKGTEIPLVLGDVAYIDGKMPSGCEVTRSGNKYALIYGGGWGRGSADIQFRFASRPVKNGEWRETSFAIPAASVRKLSVECDRDDLEIRFPGALDVQRTVDKEKKTIVTAFLGLTSMFAVNWKPEIKRFDSELVVACEANTIATASVGALRIDSVYTYRVIQGALAKLEMDIPDVNVTQVKGDDIQEWRIDRTDPKKPRLLINLSVPVESVYRLQVESEMILPKFPSKFDLPVFVPRGVLRTSGFLLVGTDSAIKLQVTRTAGLTQVDQASFPMVSAVEGRDVPKRASPSRSTYAYQYASVPYTMEINADDIVTSFSANNLLALSLVENDLMFTASVELDIKDAPAREIMIDTGADSAWTVTSITGANVSEADADVREENGRKLIYIPFRSAVSGAVLINVKMEKPLGKETASFTAPVFKVMDAKSERGFLVVAGEKGIRLKKDVVTGLTEVHTGSVPVQVKGAQYAFRFKSGDWSLSVNLERTAPAVHCEAFHLVSLGEGVMYCSVTHTYHITGAPVQEFVLKIPEAVKNFEFSGADIESWKRDGELCTVRLQTRIMGDYTLLVSYDRQFNYFGQEAFELGGISAAGTESEVGWVALASHATVKPEVLSKDQSTFSIERDEIPTGYAATINAPVIASFKYVSAPHIVTMKVSPYEREQLLGQVADRVELHTELTKDGESVTTAEYFIKNASEQYLVLKMPEKVNLWTVKYINEDGTRTAVQPQESDEGILIPVSRPRDPNKDVRIEVVYARKHGELNLFRGGIAGLKFEAPVLPHTQTAFAGWKVEVPEGYVICGNSGNLASDGMSVRNPFVNVLRIMKRIGAAPFRSRYSLRTALTKGFSGERSMEYTSSVVSAAKQGGDPLYLRLMIAPRWIGGESSVRLMVLFLAAGVAVLISELFRKRRGLVLSAGLTLLITGMVQFAAGRAGVAVLGWLIIAVLLLVAGFKGGFRLIRRGAGWIFSGLGRLISRAWRRDRTGRGMTGDFPLESETGGYAGIGLLGLMALSAVIAAVIAVRVTAEELPVKAVIPAGPTMDIVSHQLTCPAAGRVEEKSALAVTELEFKTESRLTFRVLPADNVLTDYDLNSRHLEINARADGYYLAVARGGEYRVKLTYRVPVKESEGRSYADIMMLSNIRNNLKISVPEPEMDIAVADAVLFKTADDPKRTVAEAVFGPADTATVTWRPRIRKTRLEESLFFSEVNTYAALQAGVIDFANVIRYQIAQGEVREFKVRIPGGMSVTAVRAEGVATWSFDPEKMVLDVVLERAVSGDFAMTVVTQIAREGLPYKSEAGVPVVIDAARQRGSVAFAAPDNVQVRISEIKGLNPMNIEDFAPGIELEKNRGERGGGLIIRKAYRYNVAEEVSALVEAEQVLAEIRVEEAGSVSVSDERIVLATGIGLVIAKAGIFSCELWIPEEYEVETLTGRDVSHWDELKGGRRGVAVYFNRQITGKTELNIVAARTEKGVEGMLAVPRVEVKEAARHNGRMTVSGERGIRLMVDQHRGVDIRKASEEGIRQSGVIVFDILRPNWEMKLKTDVLSPVVKPEVLQIVRLTEGMLHCSNIVRCNIENAGVKTFVIKSPVPGVPVTVAGRSIARVHEIDKEKGLWQVDLHSKVENLFEMTVTYQIPYNPSDRSVKVRPIEIIDATPQKGYIAVISEGRIQVIAEGVPAGLKPEDARGIPGSFKAGNLSDAVLCYGTIDPVYELKLSVVRHDAAKVLPASINKVVITSTMSTDGELLTRVVMNMTAGDMRFLRMELPGKKDRLWAVLVNGSEVATSRDGDGYVIPLEDEDPASETAVELVYAGSPVRRGFGSEIKYEAPKFGLPLSNIEWHFFAVPGYEYYGFGGTMEESDVAAARINRFDTDDYYNRNEDVKTEYIERAQENLSDVDELIKQGKQKQAKKKLQEAVSWSQADVAMNEDARVQYRNLVKQQVKVGLLNRRDAVRYNQNIIDEQQLGQMEAFRDGEYDQEYARRLEGNLSVKDSAALDAVADKMFEQQAAAAGSVAAIRVTVPEHGRLIKFLRARHIDPADELSISFKRGGGWLGGMAGQLIPVLIIFGAIWFAMAGRGVVRG